MVSHVPSNNHMKGLNLVDDMLRSNDHTNLVDDMLRSKKGRRNKLPHGTQASLKDPKTLAAGSNGLVDTTLSDKNKSDSGTSAAAHMDEALTPERLDGTNYVEWSLNAQNKIKGRKHWGYINGSKTAPKNKESYKYEEWENENCLVKSWLLDSMTKEIRSLFIRLATAKEIWEAVKEAYSVNQDASREYQLYHEIISTKQNGGSVITYFRKLQRLWQEYDAIKDCTMECSKDVKKYNMMVNSQRVYVFLAGLDQHLDGVRGRILATAPLPNIQSVYATVCAEANCQE